MPEKIDLKKIFLILEDYLDKNNDPESKVVNYQSPEELKRKINFSIGRKGISQEEFFNLINLYLEYSVRTGNKQFFNQLFQGHNSPGFIGEVIAAATNTSMYTFEVAPVATLIEKELIKKMSSYIGFPNSDGALVPGGSYSNMVAVLTARDKFDAKIKDKGLTNNSLVIFISDQAHYSFKKAASILGLGIDNVISVKSDSLGRMIPEKLDESIKKAIKDGKKPFFIGATAGTTILGAFDPIESISEIAKKYNLWLHVDGAFGGSVILSKKHKKLMNGIELADSVSWNPHKLMGLPLACSAIIIKEKYLLERACSVDHGSYLFHNDEDYDLGKKSLLCGRKVDSLKLWLAWKYFGEEGYEKRIDKLFSFAEYAKEKIDSIKDMELVKPVQSLNICFRFIDSDKSDKENNEFNLKVRNHLSKSGASLVNYATIEGKISFRLVLANPDLEREDIDALFKNLEKSRKEVEK